MTVNPFSFKTLFWSYTCCAIPFGLIAGILCLFNVSAVYFNDAPVYGFKGFLIMIFFIPMAGLVMTITNWLALNFGRLIYNKFLKLKASKASQ